MMELTDERILEIAHRTATRYTHRSDPNDHSYGFVNHTLLDFARKVLAEAAADQLRAAILAAKMEERERCAQICDGEAAQEEIDNGAASTGGAAACAAAIRKG